jgi:hypothetical protein
VKKPKSYRLRIRLRRLQGKYQCPECERKFKTALARTNHGVGCHQWIPHMFQCDETRAG